jgi:ABC-type phosphate/phosphonate transport system ATPase subunit
MWKDSETELDFLDYNYLVQSMMAIINDNALLPACIGLYGDWGSGKSSLIRMCKLQIEKNDPKAKCLVCVFSGIRPRFASDPARCRMTSGRQ